MRHLIEKANRVKEIIFPLTNKFSDVEPLLIGKRHARRQHIQQNPIMPNAADMVMWCIWDTYKVAAAGAIGSSFQFFTQPIGTNSKTKMDTNLEQVQRLPDPQWFNCTAIGLEYGPDMSLGDIQTVINNYYLEFWVGGKVYIEGRFPLFPSGSGVGGSPATTAVTTTLATYSNGTPAVNNMFDLRLPAGIHLGNTVSDGLTGITILQGQQFKVAVSAPGGSQNAAAAPAVGVRLICNLYGMLSRGVQ